MKRIVTRGIYSALAARSGVGTGTYSREVACVGSHPKPLEAQAASGDGVASPNNRQGRELRPLVPDGNICKTSRSVAVAGEAALGGRDTGSVSNLVVHVAEYDFEG